jgi:hypothetical protein
LPAVPARILQTIVISQFAATSLRFAGAAANAATLASGCEFLPLLAARFATGFFPAGMNPVGTKIASGWYDRDLGLALGWLVRALVLGIALPHLIRAVGGDLPWQEVILSVSGGVDRRRPGDAFPRTGRPASQGECKIRPGRIRDDLPLRRFRASAFGYFGHMWELHAFYAFLPVLLAARLGSDGATVSVWTSRRSPPAFSAAWSAATFRGGSAARALPICNYRRPAYAASSRRWRSCRLAGVPRLPVVLRRGHCR